MAARENKTRPRHGARGWPAGRAGGGRCRAGRLCFASVMGGSSERRARRAAACGARRTPRCHLWRGELGPCVGDGDPGRAPTHRPAGRSDGSAGHAALACDRVTRHVRLSRAGRGTRTPPVPACCAAAEQRRPPASMDVSFFLTGTSTCPFSSRLYVQRVVL